MYSCCHRWSMRGLTTSMKEASSIWKDWWAPENQSSKFLVKSSTLRSSPTLFWMNASKVTCLSEMHRSRAFRSSLTNKGSKPRWLKSWRSLSTADWEKTSSLYTWSNKTWLQKRASSQGLRHLTMNKSRSRPLFSSSGSCRLKMSSFPTILSFYQYVC